MISKDYNNGDNEEPISKSQRKRDMHELQNLGQQLSTLSAAKLKSMALPEQLLDAILQLQQISAHGANKRQIQYIGKLMREIDAQPIRDELAKINNQSKLASKEFHEIESWRDRLLTEGNTAFTAFINEHPDIDKQKLRQLMRNAQKEQQQNKPPHSSRKLFQYLKQLLTTD